VDTAEHGPRDEQGDPGVPPPNPDAPEPPFLWGDEDAVRERLGEGVSDVAFETGTVDQRAVSPTHLWEGVRTQSGLSIVALENVDEADRPALDADMVAAVEPYFDDSRNVVELEYRLTIATAQ
jgi:hypothetical protein